MGDPPPIVSFNDLDEKFLLEEFKALAAGAVSNFQMLVGWFTFFNTFQLAALGFMVIHKVDDFFGRWTIIAASFLIFHILGIYALCKFWGHLRGLKNRIHEIILLLKGYTHDPVQYSLYKSSIIAMVMGMVSSLSVWLYLIYQGVS